MMLVIRNAALMTHGLKSNLHHSVMRPFTGKQSVVSIRVRDAKPRPNTPPNEWS